MKRIKRSAVALLGAVACLGLPSHADEFTVGHTGADLAFSQYAVTGAGIGVAVIDSGIMSVKDLIINVAWKPLRRL